MYGLALLFYGYWGSFLGLKQPGHEVYQSPPYKVKNGWHSTLQPVQCVHSVDTENFTFLV